MKLWSPNLDAICRPGFLAPTYPQVPYQPGLPLEANQSCLFSELGQALSFFRYPLPGFLQGP